MDASIKEMLVLLAVNACPHIMCWCNTWEKELACVFSWESKPSQDLSLNSPWSSGSADFLCASRQQASNSTSPSATASLSIASTAKLMLSLKAWKSRNWFRNEDLTYLSLTPQLPKNGKCMKMLWTVIQSLTQDGRSINLIHPTNLNSWPPHGRWKGVVQSMVACHPVLKNASVGTLARLWILKVFVDLVHCLADLYPHWTAVVFQVQKILHCAAGTAILPCSGHNHMA